MEASPPTLSVFFSFADGGKHTAERLGVYGPNRPQMCESGQSELVFERFLGNNLYLKMIKNNLNKTMDLEFF